MNNNEIVYGSFNSVEVEKEKLLNILKENKEKHNNIYNASISGYYIKVEEWTESVKEYADKHSEKLKSCLETIKSFLKEDLNKKEYQFGCSVPEIKYPKIDTSIKTLYPQYPAFPTSYESSYNQAIKKLELSIHDKFKLSEEEFQKYVMNNWEWKNTFINVSSNHLYNTQIYTGSLFNCSGYNSISGAIQSF